MLVLHLLCPHINDDSNLTCHIIDTSLEVLLDVRKEKGLARSHDVPLGDVVESAFQKCSDLLEANTPVQTGEFTGAEVDVIKDWGLITTKPQVYVVNLSKRNFIRKASKWLPKIKEWIDTHGGGQILPMSCEFEQTFYDLREDPVAQKGSLVLA